MMQFLGTAAADAMPGPFCECWICQEARREPAKNRLRSLFLLDEENIIDCGPDLAAACMKWQVNLSALKNIFLTHTHEDHLCVSNAGLLIMSRTRGGVPVDLYLSGEAYDTLMESHRLLGSPYDHLDARKSITRGVVRLVPITLFEPFTVDGYEVFAVPTTHRIGEKERAINYLFTIPDGRTLLYACDTGLYPRESLEALEGRGIDILIMEATFGSRLDNDTSSHLNGMAFLQQLDTFLRMGIITGCTRVYATHINHKHEFNHEQYQAFFDERAPVKVVVASDGLMVE